MPSELPIVCLTCNAQRHLVPVFAKLLNLYWRPNPEVLVVGDLPPTGLPDNFRFHSIGHYPVEMWSNTVIALTHLLKHPIFLLMLEDYWLKAPVDAAAVDGLHDLILRMPNVLRIDLSGDRSKFQPFETFHNGDPLDGFELVLSKREARYRLSMMAGLWRSDHLRRYLVPGETPWATEIHGSPRASADPSTIVLGTRPAVLDYEVAYRRNRGFVIDKLRAYPEEAKDIMRTSLAGLRGL